MVPYFKEPQPYPKSEDIYIHSNVLTFRVGLWFLILRFLILKNHNPTLKVKTYDWVAAWGHFPCWRPHQTCHLWKLALGLCDVQLSSDFNMSETLTHTVKWPQELAIYGPRPDLWPLRFGKNFEPLSRLNLESYLSSYLWRTIFQLVCGISPYSALLGLTGSFIAFADWPN